MQSCATRGEEQAAFVLGASVCRSVLDETLRLSEDEIKRPNATAPRRRAVLFRTRLCRYDMEDAMILNKASVERGLFHGCVYKTKVIDAAPSSARAVSVSLLASPFSKSSSRGCFANARNSRGSVARCLWMDAQQEAEEYRFSNASKLGKKCLPSLDTDGLPPIGGKIVQGKALCRWAPLFGRDFLRGEEAGEPYGCCAPLC